jgi:S-adenosylmethionine:tRNA ribosyltransferase-isomerase
MKTRDFFFNIPEARIAQHPPLQRGESRLLVLDRHAQSISHRMFGELPDLIKPGSVVVLNDSRVRKARVFASAADSGGKVEFLFLEKIDTTTWKTIVSKSKRQKTGKRFIFGDDISATIEGDEADTKIVRFDSAIDESFFERFGHVPLPPYIKRSDEEDDQSRYQTVFSKTIGSAAAPTAGLHFSETLIEKLKSSGIDVATITLHVGIGTFLPIRTENIEEHRMHSEEYTIPENTANRLNAARKEGQDIIAVGTTVVRTLESACTENGIPAGSFSTGLFIYPGYEFKFVNKMITNFHTPESSLLVLVSAFAGKDFVMRAYREAIEKEYRFFSYGDAMFII